MLPHNTNLFFFLLFCAISIDVVNCKEKKVHLNRFACGEYLDMQLCPDFDQMLADVSRDLYRYNKAGFLVLPGNSSTQEFAGKQNIYFRKNFVSNCTESGENAQIPNFQFEFCLRENKTCAEGMTICYEPQLIKGNVDEKYVLKNRRTDIVCPNSRQRGIHVSTDETGDHFLVKVSIDKHIYKFPRPSKPKNQAIYNPCFQIRMGNYGDCDYCPKTLAASITNMQDEKLIFTGDPPVHFENNFYYQDENFNNFWQLFLDFMPVYNAKRAYYYTGIYYKGSDNCSMSVTIAGYGLFTCKYYTDLQQICGPNKPGATTTCSVTMKDIYQKQTGKEHGISAGTTEHTEDGFGLSQSVNAHLGPEIAGIGFELGRQITHTYAHDKENIDTTNFKLEHMGATEIERKMDVVNPPGDNSPIEIDVISLDCMGTRTYMNIFADRKVIAEHQDQNFDASSGIEGTDENEGNKV